MIMLNGRPWIDPASPEGLANTLRLLSRVEAILTTAQAGRSMKGSDIPALRALCAELGRTITGIQLPR